MPSVLLHWAQVGVGHKETRARERWRLPALTAGSGSTCGGWRIWIRSLTATIGASTSGCGGTASSGDGTGDGLLKFSIRVSVQSFEI